MFRSILCVSKTLVVAMEWHGERATGAPQRRRERRLRAWELPVLSNLAGPIQHFRAAVLKAWRKRVAADLCAREERPMIGYSWYLQLLNSDHVRERDKALLRGVLVGGAWNGLCWGR